MTPPYIALHIISPQNSNLNSKKHPFPGAFLIYCSISCLFLPQAQVET